MKLGALATLQKIPDGPAGIYATLKIMRRLARDGKTNLIVRYKTLAVVETLPSKAYGAEVEALFTYVRDHIRYVKDIAGVETVAAPQITLDLGQGDCDDQCVLLASMLESISHRSRFVALSLKPGIFSHVIVESKIGTNWVALDPTEPVPMGWYPPGVLNRMEMYNR